MFQLHLEFAPNVLNKSAKVTANITNVAISRTLPAWFLALLPNLCHQVQIDDLSPQSEQRLPVNPSNLDLAILNCVCALH